MNHTNKTGTLCTDPRRLFVSCGIVVALSIIMPILFLEAFPFSVYPMLSDSWSTYSVIVADDDEGRIFLESNRINSNYSGIPEQLPVGRKYKKTLLRFGQSYSVHEVMELISTYSPQRRLCFNLVTYSQNEEGAYGIKSKLPFCLTP